MDARRMERTGQVPGSGILTLTPTQFDRVCQLAYKRFGIQFNQQKKALLEARLRKLIELHDFRRFEEYFDYLKTDRSGRALSDFVNQVTTNHTYFYREHSQLLHFRDVVLPELSAARRGAREINVWSAGCSTGEEPYTLAMLMMEHLGAQYSLWRAGVLATDVSAQALAVAREGIYDEENVMHLPAELRQKYLHKRTDGRWEVAARVKQEVVFRRFNLKNAAFPFRTRFHVIFCRNVFIYFDQANRDTLVRRFHDHTVPGGHLFVGLSESLRGAEPTYRSVKPSIYRKTDIRPAPRAPAGSSQQS